jgi:lincosamide nucleotidyltransferase A/C/D/E
VTLRLALLRATGRVVARTPARRVLDGDLARRLRLRAGREMTASRARQVVDALAAAGLPHWLGGGWGVDALVGRQTRPHLDLDVVVDGTTPNLRGRVTVALAAAGLRPAADETSIPPLPTVWVFADGQGATVDVLPAQMSAPPFDGPAACVTGVLDGRPVACLSVEVQRRLRAGYRHRRADRDDLAVLHELPPA